MPIDFPNDEDFMDDWQGYFARLARAFNPDLPGRPSQVPFASLLKRPTDISAILDAAQGSMPSGWRAGYTPPEEGQRGGGSLFAYRDQPRPAPANIPVQGARGFDWANPRTTQVAGANITFQQIVDQEVGRYNAANAPGTRESWSKLQVERETASELGIPSIRLRYDTHDPERGRVQTTFKDLMAAQGAFGTVPFVASATNPTQGLPVMSRVAGMEYGASGNIIGANVIPIETQIRQGIASGQPTFFFAGARDPKTGEEIANQAGNASPWVNLQNLNVPALTRYANTITRPAERQITDQRTGVATTMDMRGEDIRQLASVLSRQQSGAAYVNRNLGAAMYNINAVAPAISAMDITGRLSAGTPKLDQLSGLRGGSIPMRSTSEVAPQAMSNFDLAGIGRRYGTSLTYDLMHTMAGIPEGAGITAPRELGVATPVTEFVKGVQPQELGLQAGQVYRFGEMPVRRGAGDVVRSGMGNMVPGLESLDIRNHAAFRINEVRESEKFGGTFVSGHFLDPANEIKNLTKFGIMYQERAGSPF